MNVSLPNVAASTEDFEFAALAQAKNYRSAIVEEFRPYLKGNVIEIGAGIGQITAHLRTLPEIGRLVAVEPDPRFAVHHGEHCPWDFVKGTVVNIPKNGEWDALILVNVLEHIEDDTDELRRYHEVLGPRSGFVCLLVPARPELYSPIDRDFGHFRRYTRPELRGKLHQAGFCVERLCYYNSLGYFAWLAGFKLLRSRKFSTPQVRLYDRLCFPLVHWIESRVARPPFGQSLIAVARAI